MRWLLGFALVLAVGLGPTVVSAQVVEACDVPWLDATRLAEVLRIEVGEVDAIFRIDECSGERARVSIVRDGRVLVRFVPWGDTPDELRVRLIAIVLAELLHTDEALRELASAERDDPYARATNRPAGSDPDPSAQVEVAEAAVQTDDGAASPGALAAVACAPLVLDARLGLRIFPPLPLRRADNEFVTVDAGLGVQWRRLLARASVLARSRGDAAGTVTFRAYLGSVGARLLDVVDGAWRVHLDLLASAGLMHARAHFDERPDDGASVRQRFTGGLALGLGVAHDRARSRVGFSWELGYLRGMTIDQGGRRVGTLDGWNVAFYLSVGLRVRER
ncbi:MAG: hypothetical protein H6725_18785 [Sandaracinaceae bacterium]|nr:hypothetical protein [Sandaracinaceae bacterium]